MNERDPLSAWIEGKREGAAPAGFPARVMEAVRAEAQPVPAGAWFSKPWLLAGAWVAASLVLAVRLVAVVAVLWAR